MRTDKIAERFARDTADHVMTVLHDDGLYRHLRFRGQRSFYWFELITAPGSLTFQGDGEGFVFRRVEDMFEFFRGPVGRINPGYWAEKLVSGRGDVMRYDIDIFEAEVERAFVDAVRDREAPAGLGKAVRADLLDTWEFSTEYEEGARQALDAFEFEGFRFEGADEWNLRDYDWWFLWALHGIVWGIAQYDAAKGNEPAAGRPVPPALRPPAIVDVHLPEPAEVSS